MKNRIPQATVIFALVVLLAISLPSSFAKYTDLRTYNVNLVKEITFQQFEYVVSSSYGDTSIVEYPIKKTGYYAIVAKGGSGSNGLRVKSGMLNKYVDDYYAGGTGGIVAGYVYLSRGQKVYLCAGSVGEYGKYNTNGGDGGKNKTGFGTGGDGGTIIYGLTKACSGGGGAASTVTIGTSSMNNISNVLVIAAGGGASGANDVGYASSIDAGNGGNGGSNYGTVSTIYPVSTGTVYGGYNGTVSNTKTNYGYGATDQPGKSNDGNKGKSFVDLGAGGSTLFDSLAGPGGGGYCGGGGATGSGSSKTSSGGGGGGSSYMATIKYSMQSLSTDLFNYTIGKSNGACSTSNSGGFAIIAYLGNEPTVPTT